MGSAAEVQFVLLGVDPLVAELGVAPGACWHFYEPPTSILRFTLISNKLEAPTWILDAGHFRRFG